MKAVVAKNIGIEGPGTLGRYLDRAGYETVTIDFQKGERLPADAGDISLFILLGGPMGAYEKEKYPYLRDQLKFIELCLKEGGKVIGLCLGAQMIARALGAEVTKNHKKEIGWYGIKLTEAGISSPLFDGLPQQFSVFQWHGDTFGIPSGADNLAESDLCRNQAFVCGGAMALQFHIEIENENDIGGWCELYGNELTAELGDNAKNLILETTKKEIPKIAPIAEKFYSNINNWVND